MSTFRKIGDDMKEGFSKVPAISSMMHLDVILVFGSLAFMLVNLFLPLGIIGDFIGAFDWYILIIGLIMCWANGHTQFLYSGLYGYAAFCLIAFLRSVFSGYFGFSTLVTVLIYAGLGFLVMSNVKD